MRFLETLILILAAILPFMLNLKVVRVRNKPIAALLFVLLIAHLILEGPRWQMSTLYLIYGLCLLLIAKGHVFFKGGSIRKIMSGLFLFFMLAVGLFLSSVLPVFDLPTPTGQYQVGARYLHVITDEKEYITEDKEDKRAFMVKVWYPSNVSGAKRELYLDEGGRKGFAKKYRLPANTFSYLDKVNTHTFIEPDFAEGTFPVLVFSHGYNSNAFGYYALTEEIVSQGYIVLNINHTYESVGSMFPSGEFKFYDKTYDREHNNEEMARLVWEATENFKQATKLSEKRLAIDFLLKNYYASEITERWENDIHEVIRLIPNWNETTFLDNHMDTSKIGVLGHSQGGSAIGQALLNNPSIVAGINLDGVQWGEMVDTALSKPFLLVTSDWAEDHPDFNEIAYHSSASPHFFNAKIKDSGHSNFMDIPFMINLPLLNEAGKIKPKRAIKITSEIVVDFFDKYLNDVENDLYKLTRFYPELEIAHKDQ